MFRVIISKSTNSLEDHKFECKEECTTFENCTYFLTFSFAAYTISVSQYLVFVLENEILTGENQQFDISLLSQNEILK